MLKMKMRLGLKPNKMYNQRPGMVSEHFLNVELLRWLPEL